MFRQVAKRAAKLPAALPKSNQLLPANPAEDEERAGVLSERLRAEPGNDDVVVELADLLGRLGRDLDVFALLSARLEDASGPARAPLLARQKLVLERLVERARHDGRIDEEKIYRQALAKIGR
jgi:hypothetical protein